MPRSPREVLKEHRKRLLGLEGVQGVAWGLSPTVPAERRILVYSTRLGWPEGLEKEIEGYKVELVSGKPFRPLKR